MNFQPMLADDVILSQLRYPVMVSPKYDGIRAMTIGGKLQSRNLKPFRNKQLQIIFSDLPEGLDGELIEGDPKVFGCWPRTQSVVSSFEAEATNVRFFVFDVFLIPQLPYRDRMPLKKWHPKIEVVPQFVAEDETQLLRIEEAWVDKGYEGVMIRDPNAPYKFGRSTVKEGYLLKFKRFTDTECPVVAFEELQHNHNELTRDAMGYAERSSHKSGMVPGDTLGALILDWKGQALRVGTGFTQEQRKHIWANRSKYSGALVKVKYWSIVKDLPRHPVFLGFVE